MTLIAAQRILSRPLYGNAFHDMKTWKLLQEVYLDESLPRDIRQAAADREADMMGEPHEPLDYVVRMVQG